MLEQQAVSKHIILTAVFFIAAVAAVIVTIADK